MKRIFKAFFDTYTLMKNHAFSWFDKIGKLRESNKILQMRRNNMENRLHRYESRECSNEEIEQTLRDRL